MKQILPKSLALAFTVLSLNAWAQPSLKLNKGDQYQLVSDAKMIMSVDAMGQSVEINGSTVSSKTIRVDDVANGNFNVVSVLDKLKFTMDEMGNTRKFDSEAKDNSEEMKEIENAIGKESKMVVSAQGIVIEKPKDAQLDPITMMASMMGAASGGNANDFELALPAILKSDMKAGAKWVDSSTVKTEKMNINISGTYEIVEATASLMKVKYTGQQKINGAVEQMGMEMETSGTNKIDAEYHVDPSTGVLQESNVKITVGIAVNAMGAEMPMTGSVTTNTKVSKKS